MDATNELTSSFFSLLLSHPHLPSTHQIEAEQAALSPHSREAARKQQLALQQALDMDSRGGFVEGDDDDGMDEEIARYQEEAMVAAAAAAREQVRARSGSGSEEEGEGEGMDLS